MDIKTVLAAAPWLKRAWRYTPPVLRVPLLVLTVAVVVWYVATGRHRDEEPTPAEA